MYVRVHYLNKIYYSYVFMHFEVDYMPHVVVYDSIDNKFEVVSVLSKSIDGVRQVGYMNEKEDGFEYINELLINKRILRKCKGYSWLINNIQLINSIFEGKEIDSKLLKSAKEMNDSIDPNRWNEVTDENDAVDFMNHVGAFHDTYLVGMEAEADEYDFNNLAKLRLKFSSQGAFDILMEFEGDITIKYTFTTTNRIYLSSIVFDENQIYWVDGDEDLRPMDIQYFDYIQGQKLRWKFILKENSEW